MKNLFLLLTLSFSFVGCSLIYSYSDDLPQRLDEWMQEKNYNTALNTIDYIKPDHKDYRIIQKKKILITKKMNAYEKSAIDKSKKLASQGNWIKAINLLDEASDNILDTDKIDKQRENLLSKRDKVITAYEDDVLYNQAINLSSKMKLYSKIKKTVSENEDNLLDISKFDEMRHETSVRLTQRSEQQFEQGQYENTLSTITLALKLKPNKDVVTRLKEIKKRVRKINRLKKSFYIKDAKSILRKLSQGYSHSILNETKRTISWLERNNDNSRTNRRLIRKLKRHLSAGIKQRFEAGRKLYSEGKTQQALSIWSKLKELDPNNLKLESNINRAEKVLIKLKELSNKPGNKK